MKLFVLLAAAAVSLGLPVSVSSQELQPANWDIYFEPIATLQTGAQIPFQITVHDPLHKPVIEAKVTLQIETADHQKSQTFKAPAVDQGVYLAKPVFSKSGQWNVSVDVHRNDREGGRTIQYNVPN